jgi:MFS family permease
MGMNAAQQLRIAAADMYPASLRAQAVGWVLTGSVVGTFVAPLLVAAGESHAAAVGSTPLGFPWLIMPLLILSGIGFILAVRPDPRDIAAELHRYFPSVPPPDESLNGIRAHRITIGGLLDHAARRSAILCNAACHGNMSITMVTTSLVLAHHGSTLAEISVAGALHGAGMFGFSLPLGWLSDRLGRRTVLVGGVGVATLGAILVAWGHDYPVVTIGSFLVGLGWAASHVSTTALIADTTESYARGRAIGLSDSLASATSIAAAVVTGLVFTSSGIGATGYIALLLMAPALALALQLPSAQPERLAAEVPLLRADS